MDAPHVWVANDDGTDIIRAEAIVRVGTDYNGNVTVQLTGGAGAALTLVVAGPQQGQHTLDDLHRQLIRALAQLSDAAGAFLVRPACDEQHGWRWVVDPL